MKKIIVSSDDSAFWLKEEVLKRIQGKDYEITDVSLDGNGEQLPYYEAGRRVGEAVSRGEYEWGLLFCGSGMGVTMAANRFRGVYCAICESIHTAKLARIINRANVLALGGNIVAPDLAVRMVETFFHTDFLEGTDGEEREFLQDALEKLDAIDAEAHRG